MQQGKHTDYEKQLHDDMIAGLSNTPAGESPPSPQQSIEQERDRGEIHQNSIKLHVAYTWHLHKRTVFNKLCMCSDMYGGNMREGIGLYGVSTIREGMGLMEPAWPDLGHTANNKSRFLSTSSKEDDKSSKSKR